MSFAPLRTWAPLLRRPWFLSTVTGAVLFVVYVVTLAPGLVGGDTPEMITSARVVGIPHQPGYPLYVLVGRIFTLLPIESVAVRVNLLSAVAGAAAGAVLCRWLIALGAPGAAAVLLALTAGFSRGTWSQAVVAEVYTAGLVLGLLALYLFDRWHERGDLRMLWMSAYLGGLAVGHQPLTVMLLPAPLFLLLRRVVRHSLSRGQMMAAIGFFAMPFTVFALLPIRSAGGPAIDYAQIRDVGDFFYHALGVASRSELLGEGVEGVRRSLDVFGELPFHAIGLATIVIAITAILGLEVMARRDRDRLLVIWLPIPLILGFATVYSIHDIENYLILPFWLMVASSGFFLGLGLPEILSRIGANRHARTISTALAALTAVVALVSNRPLCDRSRFHLVDDFVDNAFICVPPRGALFLFTETLVGPFAYHKVVGGVRPDVDLVDMTGKVLPQGYGFRDLAGDWRDARWERMQALFEAPPAELRDRSFCALRYGARPTPGKPYEYQRRGLLFELVPRGRAMPALDEAWRRFRFRMPPPPVVAAERNTFALTPLVLKVYTDTAFDVAAERMQRGAFADALVALRQALDFAPTSLPVRLALADTYRALGRLDESEVELHRVLEIVPNDPGTLSALGVLRLTRGRHGEAEDFFRKAIMANRAFPLAYLNLADLLLIDPTRSPEALAAYEQFLRLAPQDSEAPRVRETIDRLRGPLP